MFRLPQLSLVIVMSALVACAGNADSPEDQVRAAIKTMELAAEERSNSGVLDWVSENYNDHYGNDRQQLRKYIALQLLRNQNISIFTLIRSIEIVDGNAQVELSLATSGRELDLSNEANRLKADVYRISLIMKQESDDWLVQSASWQRGW